MYEPAKLPDSHSAVGRARSCHAGPPCGGLVSNTKSSDLVRPQSLPILNANVLNNKGVHFESYEGIK
jgi:hypothetical protein